jgi:hypothetical protein
MLPGVDEVHYKQYFASFSKIVRMLNKTGQLLALQAHQKTPQHRSVQPADGHSPHAGRLRQPDNRNL